MDASQSVGIDFLEVDGIKTECFDKVIKKESSSNRERIIIEILLLFMML